jgi:Fe2+ or Zn2+ uptake regulation protein
MMTYAEIVAAERRLRVLQFLVRLRGHATETEIYAALDRLRVDPRLTEDAVRADLRWLDKEGLIVMERVDAGLFAATITKLGKQAEAGKIDVEGVKAPDFGA